jgi:hypothetical protein
MPCYSVVYTLNNYPNPYQSRISGCLILKGCKDMGFSLKKQGRLRVSAFRPIPMKDEARLCI